MDLKKADQYELIGLSKINIIIGKNGCGKSSILKKVEYELSGRELGEVNYVTPERSGTLRYQAGVEQTMSNEPQSIKINKRKNQWGQFKNYSVSQYKRLELLHLREIDKDRTLPSFDSIIDIINNQLINIKIAPSNVGGDFEIFTKSKNEKLDPDQISSGESELISLIIECLTFEKLCIKEKQNYLLLDEPDVHLHPDLQANFISFLINLVETKKFCIIIATHSTAILGALLKYNDARFAILSNGSIRAEFKPLNDMYQSILPIFGAHPLSNLFNQNPILLVEGDDDVRIWQQAIRTSKGKIKFYPCSVGGIPNMAEYEDSVIEIISGVYDNPISFSLRDRDDGAENIEDKSPMIRFKLSCRAAENLILTDEVLTSLNTDWVSIEASIENWLNSNKTHSKFKIVTAFKESGYNRKDFDLKEIRNVLIGLTETSKPWEVIVGKVIGQLAENVIPVSTSENKLCNYLGQKLTNHIVNEPAFEIPAK